MATQNQKTVSSIESMLAVIEEDNSSSSYMDPDVNDMADECPDEETVKEVKPTVTKTPGRKKSVSPAVTIDAFSEEYERCLQEFKGKPFDKYSPKIPIDNDIAETLRLIKGQELRVVVNALLKTMLLCHKEEIKKYFAPKPKYIV